MRDDVFKIKLEYHGIIEQIIFTYFTHPIIDWAKNNNYTPNHLTSLSFIFQGISLFFLNLNYLYTYTFLYLIGYYFDCIDGPMARKHNMVTVFGDWYDHTTDIFCFIIANYLYIFKYNLLENSFIVASYLFFLIALVGYIGCQETIFNKEIEDKKKKSGSLYLTTLLVKNPENLIRKLRCFNFTNSVVLFSIIPHLL